MASFNIFSKDLLRQETSSETYASPKPLINFVKEVWNKGINIADRLFNIAQAFSTKQEPKRNNLAIKKERQNKDTNGSTEKSKQDQKSKHQIQESISKKYQPLPCWLDPNPNPKYHTYTPKNYHDPNKEYQPEDFLEKHIVPKIPIKKVVVIPSTASKGYMNVDKFLERLKEIKAEKKARQELKISREEFTHYENVDADNNSKPKSLGELFNPKYKEEKKLTPGQERQKFRNDFFSDKNSQSKPMVKGQTVEQKEVSSEMGQRKQNILEIQRQRENNSTILSSSQDNVQNSSQVESSSVPSSSKQGEVSNITKKQENQSTKSVSAAQVQKPKESIYVANQEKKFTQNQPSVLPQQDTTKFNPFMSAVSPTPQQGTQKKLQILNTMEEMKKKLFGNNSNSASHEPNSANSTQKCLPYFGTGQQNSFAPNLQFSKLLPVNEAHKPIQRNTSASTSTFSIQSIQSVNPIGQSPTFQNLAKPTYNLPQQNQQSSISNNAPQLPFIKNTQHSFMNQNQGVSSFSNIKNSSFLNSNQTPQNQVQLPSFITLSKNPASLSGHTTTPKGNQIESYTSSTAFKSEIGSPFGQNQMTPLVKPSLLNDEKNKMVLNSFMAASSNNSRPKQGLFGKSLNSENEDEWDRRTQKRGQSQYENRRRREKRQDRIRD